MPYPAKDFEDLSPVHPGETLFEGFLQPFGLTPHSGQCNHDRPTYVELKLADIERLFGRR